MTIINCRNSHRDHDLIAIDREAVTALRKALTTGELSRPGEVQTAIRILECFLAITRNTLRLDDIRDERSKTLFQTYIGALHSQKFSDRTIQAAYRTGRATLIALAQLGSPWQPLDLLGELSVVRITPSAGRWREDFEGIDLDPEAVYRWSGWPCTNQAGGTCYLPLFPLYRKHGREIADRLHEAVAEYMASRRCSTVPCGNELARYMATCDANTLEEIRSSGIASREFLRRFVCQFVEDKYANGNGAKVSTIVATWNAQFSVLLLDYLVPRGVMAMPLGLPMQLPSGSNSPHKRNVRTRASGVKVKTNLLTEVPLQLSDLEAKELLFRQIHTDFQSILKWASAESELLWQRCLRRKRIAPHGKVRPIGEQHAMGDLKRRTSRANPDWLANAAATYEHYGVRPGIEGRSVILYPPPFDDTAAQLGLPTPGKLLPHATLLVAEHPKLTPAFLEEIDLFDKAGKLVGFQEIDGAEYLVGLKRRRGSDNAEMRVLLSPRGAELVRQVIELTEPFRDFLRSSGDPNWRRLFLWGRLGGFPNAARFGWYTSNAKYQSGMADKIQLHAGVTREKSIALARQFCLRSVRSTRAVLIYLETESVQAMAEALGHKQYNPKLLDHYLPCAILDFFQERWIRIFQEGLIVEALKDSPLILEASNFNSLTDLDCFLTNHVLKPLPSGLDESSIWKEGLSAETARKEVLIGVDVPVLTALLSLSEAVKRAGADVPGTARYWAIFTGRVTALIESNKNRPDLQAMLNTARSQANWRDMIAHVNVAP